MNKLNDSRRSSTSGDRLRPAPIYTEPVTFHYEIQNHTSRIQKLTNAFKVYRLMVMTLICVIAGLIIGLSCRPYAQNWTERQFMYIELPGELYLRFLKLMIMPLLVSNVILSFGTIQGKLSSQLGKVSSFLYLGCNALSITVAIILALIISPGRYSIHNLSYQGEVDGLLDHDYSGDGHESINKYREYHPMSYHMVRGDAATTRTTTTTTTFTTNSKEHASSYVVQHIEPNHQESEILFSLLTDDEKAEVTQETYANGNKYDQYGNPSSEMSIEEPLSLVRLPFNIRDVQEQRNGRHNMGNMKTAEPEDMQKFRRNAISAKLPIDVLLDVLRNLVPDSVVGATMQQVRTRLFAPQELIMSKNGTMDPSPSRWPVGHEMINQPNVVGLLAISILVGVMLSHMEEASKPMLDLCACISELSLRVGMMATHLTPFCIMFLLIGQVARSRSLSFIAGELCMYSITVIVALLVYGSVILPLVYHMITKKSPWKFLLSMLEALVASFATSSSSATMALVLNCLTDAGLNPVVVRAFGPLGSVFNMNGTAIYEAIGAIFIAQTIGVTLPMTSLLLVGLSSAVAGLSTTGIPSSGMMTMVIVLNAVNLPVLQLSIIYIVDFIIDRFRTLINVWSGAIVCGLIDHICPEHMFEEEMKPEKYREMMKLRGSRGTLGGRRSSALDEDLKPQVISVTITPPPDVSHI